MTTWATKAGGLAAGGYENCVAFDPNNNGHLIVGGDTFGFNESWDGGFTWIIDNLGLTLGATGIAGITYDSVSGFAYAGMTSVSNSPTIVRGAIETHSGKSFTRWTNMPVSPGPFWGGGNPAFLPPGDTRPRLTGRIIEVNHSGPTRYVYAAPYQNGLWRSTDDYATTGNSIRIASPAQIGITNSPTTEGILLDPTDPTRMLVARWGYSNGLTNGAVLVSNIRAATVDAATVGVLTNAPPTVLEFFAIGTNVYAACGWYGVYRVSGANWTTWTPINTGFTLGTPGIAGQWFATGITGYNNGTHDVLFICSVNAPRIVLQRHANIYRLTGAESGSPTWEDLTSGASNVTSTTLGSGETWLIVGHNATFALNGAIGDMDNLAIDPFDPTHVHVVGRAGGYQSNNATASAASVLWSPSVNGQGGLTTTMFVTDPYRDGNAYVCDTDWTFIASSNDFVPGSNTILVPAGAGSKGFWVDMGPDQAAYLAAGNRDTQTQGEVYQFGGPGVNPITSTPVALGLGAVVNSNRPSGLAVVGTSATPIVIAAVSNWNDGTHAVAGGIYRKVGSGAWAQVLAAPPFDAVPAKTNTFPSAKDADGAAVYILDKNQGVFRSLDSGATWVLWWAITDGISLGCDATVHGLLYVCRKTGVWRINAANAAGTNPAGSVGIKPLTKGPMGRGWTSQGGLPVNSWALEVNWSDLQATKGAALGGVGLTAITNAITTGLPFHLRVFSGRFSPSWEKALTGTVTITDQNDGTVAVTPLWWTQEHVDDYADLQTKLAALLDAQPLCTGIFEAGRMNVYAEPFSLHVNGSSALALANVANLIAAGYTLGSDTTPHTDLWAMAQFRSHMAAVWTQTRILVAYNPFETISSGLGIQDYTEMRRQMEAWFALIGSQHTLQNNSIRSSFISNPSGPRPYTSSNTIYTNMVAMHAEGAPLSFQTAQISLIGDIFKTLDWAADMGGCSVELPNNFNTLGVTTTDLANWTTELSANGPDTTASAAVQILNVATGLQGMAVDRTTGWVYAVTTPTTSVDGALYECQNPTVAVPTFTAISDYGFASSCYSLNYVAVDNPGGQVFYMPSSIYEMINTDLLPPGVGPLQGGRGFRL